MSHPTYEIWTLQDILNVPADRRGDCLRDIEYALALLDLAAGDGQESKVYGPIRWTDDNSASVTMGLMDEDGKVVDTLKLEVTDRPD